MTLTRQNRAKARNLRAKWAAEPSYPECGCAPESWGVFNVVCRNVECDSAGTHRRALVDDRCPFCGGPFTRLVDER
jgi:hypothetical protein